MSRVLMTLLLLVLAFVPGCANYRDALVTNPCSHQITVRISSAPASEADGFLGAAHRVPALSFVIVDDGFSDADDRPGSAEASYRDRSERFDVPLAHIEPVPVLIPATVCQL